MSDNYLDKYLDSLIEEVDSLNPKWEEASDDTFVDLVEKADKKVPFVGYNKKKHSRTGGLNKEYREKVNKETGSNLQAPVTEKNPTGKRAARRKSFCARMSGVPGPTSKDGKLTPKGAALKRWRCAKSNPELMKNFLRERLEYKKKKVKKEPAKVIAGDRSILNTFPALVKSESGYMFKDTKFILDPQLQRNAEDTACPNLVSYIKAMLTADITKIPLSTGVLTLSQREKGLYNGFFEDSNGQIIETLDDMTPEIVAKTLELKGLYTRPEIEEVEQEEVEEEEQDEEEDEKEDFTPREEYVKIKYKDLEIEIKKSLHEYIKEVKNQAIPSPSLIRKALKAWRRNYVNTCNSDLQAARELLAEWEQNKESFNQIVYALEQIEHEKVK